MPDLSLMAHDIEEKVDNFILSLPCRAARPYPSAAIPVQDKRTAQLLLDAFADGGNAEFTAIAQYIHHHMTIEQHDVAQIELCISMIEMKHLEMLGEMIESLGGDPRYWRTNKHYWSGGNVGYGDTLCEKLALDIFSEQEAIAGYEALLRMIDIPQVRAVIQRIIEDELMHLHFFTEAYQKYCT